MPNLVKKTLKLFNKFERPAAWSIMVVGFLTFWAAVFNIMVTGDAKWATLLVSLDLFVSGFSAVQEVE